jgi:hypothetical protein
MNSRKRSKQADSTEADQSQSRPAAKLGPDIKAKIGQQLRVMYGEVVSEGVPDRFVSILRGLDDESEDQGAKNDSP